jgi:hypothetical protein
MSAQLELERKGAADMDVTGKQIWEKVFALLCDIIMIRWKA